MEARAQRDLHEVVEMQVVFEHAMDLRLVGSLVAVRVALAGLAHHHPPTGAQDSEELTQDFGLVGHVME